MFYRDGTRSWSDDDQSWDDYGSSWSDDDQSWGDYDSSWNDDYSSRNRCGPPSRGRDAYGVPQHGSCGSNGFSLWSCVSAGGYAAASCGSEGISGTVATASAAPSSSSPPFLGLFLRPYSLL